MSKPCHWYSWSFKVSQLEGASFAHVDEFHISHHLVTWSMFFNWRDDYEIPGQHKDKRHITYKAEDDGFQADALCDEGFKYKVYMRNDPAPKKYLKQGLSPLHSRVMALFNAVKDSYHHCTMDNLYNSAAFCRAAFNHTRDILCQGLIRKGMRGIPPSVFQFEKKSRKDQIKVRGTVKAALMEGNSACPNLVACSIYDTKPVHYLSMVCDQVGSDGETLLQCWYRYCRDTNIFKNEYNTWIY